MSLFEIDLLNTIPLIIAIGAVKIVNIKLKILNLLRVGVPAVNILNSMIPPILTLPREIRDKVC